MALGEAIAVSLGASIAKWVCGVWLGDGLKKEVTSGLVDLISQRTPNWLQRKQLERQFEQVAESAAIKLEGLISIEFRGMPEGETSAAISAAAATVETAPRDAIFAADTDPIRLKSLLFAADPDRIGRAGLSESGGELYRLLVAESCYYVIEIAMTLPPFVAQASAESLRRETEIIDIARKVLERLPSTEEINRQERDRSREYEGDYQRFIAQKYDRLELFGLTFSEISSRYALSVAYISLTLKRSLSAARHIDKTTDPGSVPGKDRLPPTTDDDSLRVEDALVNCPRAFIRGAAGSGKTTLLQWIAVRSARKEFRGPLESWNDFVPIMLQLRRFGGADLPEPADFLRFTTTGISESAPPGWVHQQMASGRVLLLIDGVDEIAEVKRNAVRNWIGDLLRVYGDCQYVVTSRPAAVPETWLAGERFVAMELQPMVLSDIRSFIEHWHDAASRDLLDSETLAELRRHQQSLTDGIIESVQLRNLATSPLLCAMLCALNLDRRSQLPVNRVELYRIALEMLLERRDAERGLASEEEIKLTLTQKTLLLRDYAYWLARNDQSDAPFSKLAERLEARLANMKIPAATGTAIANHLLVRSGLLRETVPGRVDFIHRTFQEYLTAIEVVAEDSLGLLIKHAHEDQWGEVVVLAAGLLGSHEKTSRLLSGLLDRGDEETNYRHRLHLLAVACMETAEQVDEALRQRIAGALSALLPPQTMTEARAVASAGALALPQLAAFRHSRVAEAAACVRTASLVGGDEALPVLAAFATDKRFTVQKELLRAWAAWPDPAQFSAEVLAESPLREGSLNLSNLSLLPGVPKLQKLQSLHVQAVGEISNLSLLRDIPQLQLFSANYATKLESLEFLRGCAGLVQLDLEGCSNVRSIDPLAGSSSLILLDLSGTQVADLDPISGLIGLNWLAMRNCKNVNNWSPLSSLKSLQFLNLSDNDSIHSLDFMSCHGAIRLVDLDDCPDLVSVDGIEGATKLQGFRARGARRIERVDCFQSLKELNHLTLSTSGGHSNLGFLEGLHLLRNVEIDGSPHLRSSEGLNAPHLTAVELVDCPNLTDIGSLGRSASSLSFLRLERTGIKTLNGIENCSDLYSLSVADCPNLRDLSAVDNLPDLAILDIRGVAADAIQTIARGASSTPLEVMAYHNQEIGLLEDMPGVKIRRVVSLRRHLRRHRRFSSPYQLEFS